MGKDVTEQEADKQPENRTAASRIVRATVGLALLGLALARQMGSVVMQGFVLAYLFAYMVFYYYSLAVPFSLKSLYLVATGLGLLAVALVLRLWQTKQTGGEAGHA